MGALKAVVAGGSGLVGGHLIEQLVNDEAFTEVGALLRSPLPFSHQKLRQVMISFDDLEKDASKIEGDALFCCLGSTRKKTPDAKDYRKVDFDYPLTLAQIASKNNIKQFHLVSALGADPASFNAYSRLKGETEEAIKEIELESIHIYRPSLLTGKRRENRPVEKIAIAAMNFLNPFLLGPLRKYRSIEASKVAAVMIKQAIKQEKGVFIYPSDQIEKLA